MSKPVEPIIPGFDPLTEKGEQAMVQWLGDGAKCAIAAREPFEDMVITGLMFLRQKQWLSIGRDASGIMGRKVYIPPELENKLVVDDNVGPIYRSVITGICQDIPRLIARPMHADDENHLKAAKLSTAMLKDREIIDREDDKREMDAQWSVSAGECWRYTYWDSETGRLLGTGSNEGDIATETCNWFSIAKDPQAIDNRDPRYLIHYDARDVDEIKAIFGKDVAPEDVADKTRALDRLATAVMHEREHPRETSKRSAVVYRMCIPPCAGYPEGQWFIWANGVLLRKMPLLGGIFPYQKLSWWSQPGRLYGCSLPEMLIENQKLLNILASQVSEVIHRQLRMDMLVNGWQMPEHHVDADGKHIYFHDASSGDGTFELLDYKNVNLPAAYEWIRDRRQIMQKDGGARDPSLGEVSRVDVKATEVNLARNADVASIQFYVNRLSRSWADIGHTKLKIAEKMYQNYRKLSSSGQRISRDMSEFTGSDLSGVSHVVPVAIPHLSESQKQEFMIVAQNKGWLGPYESPEHEVACRQFLINAGLDEIEEGIERIYGPVDDLFEPVKKMREMRYQALAMQLQQQLNPVPAALPGQAMPGQVPQEPPEELVAAAIQEEMSQPT